MMMAFLIFVKKLVSLKNKIHFESLRESTIIVISHIAKVSLLTVLSNQAMRAAGTFMIVILIANTANL